MTPRRRTTSASGPAARPATPMPMPMPYRVAPTSWPRIAGALVALLALNTLLSFGPWWPTPGVVPRVLAIEG